MLADCSAVTTGGLDQLRGLTGLTHLALLRLARVGHVSLHLLQSLTCLTYLAFTSCSKVRLCLGCAEPLPAHRACLCSGTRVDSAQQHALDFLACIITCAESLGSAGEPHVSVQSCRPEPGFSHDISVHNFQNSCMQAQYALHALLLQLNQHDVSSLTPSHSQAWSTSWPVSSLAKNELRPKWYLRKKSVCTVKAKEGWLEQSGVDMQVSDSSMQSVAGLPSLRQLALGHTKVGDPGLALLAALPHLTHLHLQAEAITLAGLQVCLCLLLLCLLPATQAMYAVLAANCMMEYACRPDSALCPCHLCHISELQSAHSCCSCILLS